MDKKIKLIIGLSNPGNKYCNTRHNIGSWYVLRLAKFYGKKLIEKNKFMGFLTKIFFPKTDIILFIPNIFMNLNGRSVSLIVNYYHFFPEEILIVHDDMNLSPGKSKFKFGGSHGGHNGLKNIINNLNDPLFYRLRIGIGRPENKKKIVDFVLNQPSSYEKKLINENIENLVYQTNNFFQS